MCHADFFLLEYPCAFFWTVHSSPVLTEQWSAQELSMVFDIYEWSHLQTQRGDIKKTHRRYLSKKNSIDLLFVCMRPSASPYENLFIFDYFVYIPRGLRRSGKQWLRNRRRGVFLCNEIIVVPLSLVRIRSSMWEMPPSDQKETNFEVQAMQICGILRFSVPKRRLGETSC